MNIDAFAARTGTRRNLAALRAAGWGLFVSAAGVHRHEGFRFKIDNGAWSDFTHGRPWRAPPFEALLESHGRHPLCQGIVAPDIVCGGAASLRLTLAWLERLLDYGPRVYVPVQPGMSPSTIAALLGPRIGVFVGGDSRWKEATCAAWARLAHERGTVCHVGRVNTRRRLLICKAAGVDSFDGSGPTRFEVELHAMERFRAEACQLGLVIRLEIEVFYEHDGLVCAAGFEIAGDSLDEILLALSCWEIEPIEIQTDRGFFERRGNEFIFMSWVEAEHL